MLDDKIFWKKYFRAYDTLNEAIPYKILLNNLIKHLDIKKGERILDAGSGTGNVSVLLQKQTSNVYAIDFSKQGIAIHREKDKKTKVKQGDLTRKLPYKDNFFDKVVSNNVLYTIPKEKRCDTIKELKRVLKPNGRLIVANLKENFNPNLILKDHMKKSIKKYGFLKTIKNFIVLLKSLILIMYYNYKIRKSGETGSSFFKKNEQRNLLKKCGFKVNQKTINTYSNQSYLDIGIKE